MSGIIRQSPLFRKILSAAGVVGPFAASAITLKLKNSNAILHFQAHKIENLVKVIF